MRGSHLTYYSADDDVWLLVCEDGRVLRLPFVIAIQRFCPRRTADDFHAPWFDWRRWDRLALHRAGNWQIAGDDFA